MTSQVSKQTPEKQTLYCSNKQSENSVFLPFLIPSTYRFILTASYVASFLFPGLPWILMGFPHVGNGLETTGYNKSLKCQFQTGFQTYSTEFLRKRDLFCLLKF